MATEDAQQRFRAMTLKLSEFIKQEELDKMKYYCQGFLKSGVRDKITKTVDLWSVLEERKKIGPNIELTFLRDMIKSSTDGRKDLLQPLDDYEQGPDEAMDATPSYTDYNPAQAQRHNYRPPEELMRATDMLKRKLGKDWRWFVRTLGVEDEEIDNIQDEFPRDVKEQIHRAITIYFNRKRELSTKTEMTAALRKVRRVDLAKKLELGDYT